MKELVNEICRANLRDIKKSSRQGVIPSDWRRANIDIIFEKGSRERTACYRPNSLTTVVCWLLETSIHVDVIEHLYKLLSSIAFRDDVTGM